MQSTDNIIYSSVQKTVSDENYSSDKMSDTEDEPSSQEIIEEEVGEEMEVVDAKEAEGGDEKGSDSSEDSDEDEEYEVESILQSRFVKKKKQYLVKWVNYSDEWNTWEPMENLEGSQDLVAAFEKKEAEKLKKEESEKAAALERRKQAKAEREAKRREREAEKEAKRAERAKKEADKPKKETKIKTEGRKKSRAIISSSESEDPSDDEKKAFEKPKPVAVKNEKKKESEAERRKKERKQEAKRKALKEKNEFRRMELEAERRKNMTNGRDMIFSSISYETQRLKNTKKNSCYMKK